MRPEVLESTQHTLATQASTHRVTKRVRQRPRRGSHPPGHTTAVAAGEVAADGPRSPHRSRAPLPPCVNPTSQTRAPSTAFRCSFAATAPATGHGPRDQSVGRAGASSRPTGRHRTARRPVRRRRHRRAGAHVGTSAGQNEGRPKWAALRIWLVAGEGFEPPTFGL